MLTLIALCALLTRDPRLITRLIKNENWINPTREADVSIWAVQADGKIEKAESRVTYDSVAETGISSTDTKKAWSVFGI